MGRNLGDFTYGLANKITSEIAMRKPSNRGKGMGNAAQDRDEMLEKVSNTKIGKALGWNKRSPYGE